ncbi:hypothetical protein RJ641_033769 [Dillenia turbinata]|uniref:Uncharacterized protein n=1 Tax=Dillenia turbinata TaxID=194707 RepID=A0AAN8VRX0_9MAGN
MSSKYKPCSFVHQNVSGDWDVGKTFGEKCGDGIVKMHVKAVKRNDQYVKVKEGLHEGILVRGFSGLLKKESKEAYEDWFADRVLRMLKSELCEVTERKSVPIWQIFWSFLYREGYWGLVSLRNDNRGSCKGVLKPLSVNSAFLLMMDNGLYFQDELGGCGLTCLQQLNSKSDRVDIINPNNSPSVSCSTKHDNLTGSQRRNNRKFMDWCQNLLWSSFCEAAFGNSNMNLEEVYFAKKCYNSKKLKFLKCWMKQMKKHGCCSLNVPVTSKPPQSKPKEIKGTPTDPPLPKISGIDDSALASCPESREAFLGNIYNKIQFGVKMKEVDLGAVAERPDPKVSGAFRVAAEPVKLLLQEPKDLAGKHREAEANSQTHDLKPDVPENIIRDYELQILFRMEIMRSEVAVDIEGSIKQKFVKQICSFLETIRYHLGDFFGNSSLDKYMERTIKGRYIPYVPVKMRVQYIIFGTLTILEMWSIKSTQEWTCCHLVRKKKIIISSLIVRMVTSLLSDKPERNQMEGHLRSSEPSAEDAFSQPLGNNDLCTEDNRIDEHDLRIIEAQARRERARRFASFTCWMPDLQRVWAPKQPKPIGVKIKSQKQFKRNARRRTNYDVVLETPMTGAKRSCRLHSGTADEEKLDRGTPSSGSVSKALFQD